MISSSQAENLKTIGALIRAARKKIKDDKTGRAVSQASLYTLLQKLEAPKPGKRSGVCFPATHADNQRVFMSDVERGKRALTPGQRRIVERALEWPSGVLDERFRSIDDFHSRCRQLEWEGSSSTQLSEPSRQGKKTRRGRAVDPNGIRLLPDGLRGLESRVRLASLIHQGLTPNPGAALRIVAVLGEAGVGKSHLIAEWWRRFGKQRFRRSVYTLDCARLGGDEIVRKLTEHFVEKPSTSPSALAEALSARKDALVVLEGLSSEEADQVESGRISFRPEQDLLVSAGRTDKTALRAVREMLVTLGRLRVHASFLLGIQTGAEPPGSIGIERQLNASADVRPVFVARLEPADGAQMMQDLGVENLSVSDLMHLSARLQGLPISIAAAAHYLNHALPQQVEAFLTNIDDRERGFQYFEGFLGQYLDALSNGQFDRRAHPHAFLRLLALMPGPVPKQRLDVLMATGNIERLETARTSSFERMQIPFIIDLDERIDINPIVRSLLRHELDRLTEREDASLPISKTELHWIHASAARWHLDRLPRDPSNFSKIEVTIIEGALYHLLALRDYIGSGASDRVERAPGDQFAHLTSLDANPDDITQYCLNHLVNRFLISKQNRATRFLGQFETKARLLSLFLENLDDEGRPRHLKTEDQVTIYTEIGVCWMHSGRLQLAQRSLAQARERLVELGASRERFSPAPIPEEGKFDLWRAWTDTLNTEAVIAMRLGRDRWIVDDILNGAIEIARDVAMDALSGSTEVLPEAKAILRAARRVICRYAHLRLNAGDLEKAIEHYELAIALEHRIGGKMISGDALRRYIEAIVRRGPCFASDLQFAEKLIDDQIGQKGPLGTRRRLSNDVISLFATKAMILRARGEFIQARALLEEAARHEFVLRGECSFAAKAELDLEVFRLQVATGSVTNEDRRGMDLFVDELEARHHHAMYWDAKIVLAEMVDEPRKSQLLSEAERGLLFGGWRRRKDDLDIIREGGSAVMAMGC